MQSSRATRHLRLGLTVAALFMAAAMLLPIQARAQGTDATAPSLLVANVDGTSLVLIYNELLNESSTPATTDFTVDIDGTDHTPSGVAVRGAEVALTLTTGAVSTNTVTLDYTKGSNPVEDDAGTDGNDAISFTGQQVTNHTSATNDRPVFSSETITVSVDENTASGMNVGSAVTVTGNTSGDTLTYALQSGFSTFTVDANGQIKTSASLDFESTSSYVVPLYVRDSKGPAGSGDSIWDDSIKVTINVNDVNEAPDITSTGSSHTAISKPEGTSTSEVLATYTADEPETTDTLAWTLSGNDAGDFDINPSGELTFKVVPDYENPADNGANNIYNVTVQVLDNKINTPGSTNGNNDTAVDDTIAVTVTVTNVNEAPDITSTGSSHTTISKPEGTSTSEVLATYTADEPDTTDTLMWTLSGNDANDFNISSSGQLTFKAVPDYESPDDNGGNNVYSVTVEVRDSRVNTLGNTNGNSDNAVDDSIAVTVTVTNVNEAPDITSTGSSHTAISKPEGTSTSEVLATYTADEPESGDTLTWTLSGNDAGDFDINSSTGALTFKNVPDYESPADNGANNVYNVTVNVRDSKVNTPGNTNGNSDTAVDDTIAVTVTVTNVDEAGTVTISGMESGGEELTASVTDIDGTISSLSWRWQREGSTPGSFSNISGATSNTYTTVAADVGKKLKAIASYTDPQGSGKSAEAETSGAIGASNTMPTFDDGMATTRTVPENSAVGTNVGDAVGAMDSDNDTLTYAIKSGNDGASFTIDSTDGQLKTKNGITYNYEAAKNSYTVVVTVHDGKDAADDTSTSVDDEITVTINVTDVNETPSIITTQTAISVAENQTSVLDYNADDVDSNGEANDSANTLTWSVESADDGSFFEINSSSGLLTFKNAPNFEDKQDAGADNVYNVTVTVTDNGIDGARGTSNHLSISKSLAVTVTDVNETPTLTTAPSTAMFDENATGVVATYIATDPDATTGTMSWDLQGNDAGDFNITSTVNGTAELTFKNPPDYERPDDTGTNNIYDVTVRVRDNGSSRLEDTQGVAITVNDLNETPVITGNATENFAEIEFDHTATASELVVGTYTATDDDNADNAGIQTITFDVSGTDAAHFSINTNTGVLSFSIEPDFENPADLADSSMMGASDNKYEIVVEADDGAGETNSVGTFTVTVTVTPVNETPEIPAGVNDESFAEIEYDAASADLDVMTYVPRDEETSTADLTDLSWSLAGTDAADFQITEDSTNGHGTLSFRNRPDYEEPTDRVNTTDSHVADDNMYQVIVKISDGPNTRDYPLTVTVTDENERPDINEDFNAPQTYMEIEYDHTGSRPDVHTFTAEDYDDGDTFTWSLLGEDAADLDIDQNTGVLTFDQSACTNDGPLPDFEEPCDGATDGSNTYNITVRATDNHGKVTDYAVVITVTEVNEQPSFTGTIETTKSVDEHDSALDSAGNETAYDTTTVILTYTAHDEEGLVKWSLTGTDASDFAIHEDAGTVTFRQTPNYEAPNDSGGDNVYEFTVVATDIMTGSPRRKAMQDITVTVVDIEEEGHVAIAAGDESPGVDDTVTFVLTDPDGIEDNVYINYTIQRGTGNSFSQVTTGAHAGASHTYTVQEADTGKQVRIVITYTDRRGSGKRATSNPTDEVTADPRANVPPRLRESALIVFEADAIIDIGTIRATDRDGDRITFTLLEQDDHELFELSSSGRLRAIQDLDFEDDDSLVITFTLSDGKGLDPQGNVINDTSVDLTGSVNIILFDVEEEGVITFSPQEPEAGVAQTATLEDDDGGITGQSWTWERSANRNGPWSAISGANSATYTATVNDEGFYFRVTVTYTDRRGGSKSAVEVVGPVPSENRRPLFPSTETGQRMVDENTRAGANIGAPVAAEDQERDRLTYSLTGTDAGAFTIVQSTGQIRVKDALDFETKSRYTVTVEVHDGKDGAGATSTTIDDTQNVTITVVNVEEPGTVTLTSETATIQARVPVTASLEDDDGPTNITWQWARSRSRTSGWANIAGATDATFTPTDTDTGGYIRATASYNDGEDSGKTSQAVSSRVGQAPPVNSAPAFPATERGQREVAEDATGNTPVGNPVVANDFNNDPLTYSLTGTDAALFTIGTNNGQIRVASGATLDFETKRTLRVTVEVSDGKNSLGDLDNDAIDDRQNVTITLTDVNEAPVVTGDASPSVAENLNRAVATYTGTDPERDTLTWSVTGSDFWISQRGQLFFASPPNYEERQSYSVTITAEDEDGLSDSLSVSVTVTDTEEAGVVTITPLRGWEGTNFRAALEDDDNIDGSVDWQWQRSSNRSSWSDIPTNATSSSYTATVDDIGRYLRAVASYDDDRGSGKEASAALTGRIADAIDRPSSNTAPAFDDPTAERSVGQGTARGRNIGAPVGAIDADSDDILTYSLAGSHASLFNIDPATGQLKTWAVLDYDSEGTNTYEVQVRVHDGFDFSYSPTTSVDATITVTITVTEVAQRVSGGGGGGGGGGFGPAPTAPRFVDGFRTTRLLAVNARPGDAVGDPVDATHPNDDDLTYTLGGANASLFTVDAETGQVRLGQGVTLELGETYTVNVTATDESGTGALIIVEIEVVEGPADPYDLNGNGAIEKNEIVMAVSDYFAGLIDKETVVALLARYFAG